MCHWMWSVLLLLIFCVHLWWWMSVLNMAKDSNHNVHNMDAAQIKMQNDYFWAPNENFAFECFVFLKRDGGTTSEMDGCPSTCWHAPRCGCLFLRATQVMLAATLKNLSNSYWGALSLDEVPEWHAVAPVPASAFLPAFRPKVTVPGGGGGLIFWQ